MAIIGYNSIGGSGWTLWSNPLWCATKFQAPINGSVSSIKVYLEGSSDVGVAIYEDNEGNVGDLLNGSSIVAHSGNSWHEISISETELIEGNYYWLVFQVKAGYTVTVKRASGDTGQTQLNYNGFSFPLDWSSKPSLSSQDYKYSIYADITPGPIQQNITSDSYIKVTNNQENLSSDSKIVIRNQENITSDSYIKVIGQQQNLTSDSYIKVIGQQQNLTSDSVITTIKQENILSDSYIEVTDNQETILSDSKIVVREQENILSDSYIEVTDNQETILSDSFIAIQQIYDIPNKINFTKGVLKNISNKFNSAIRIFKNIENRFNSCIRVISDITNDFRSQKRVINNIKNDIRFIKSWQQSGDAGIQSLGKGYIKVYIDDVEQTDTIIDTININKSLSTYHTARFELGRTYDSTKPDMESEVKIKYNEWVLYKGYITNISPTDSDEHITIECKDEYWKQNQSNSYFNVGHKPMDNKELYYSTINSALSTEFSWTPGISYFIPQNISCFSTGKSDAITSLIESSGNYSWYYDINGNKKLWKAGYGSIININRQISDNNIKLYDMISHRFSESISDLVNKFRVQMGDKIIRKFNSTGGNRQYSAYNYRSFSNFLKPDWDGYYEELAINSSSGYGWDYHTPDEADNYKDVYKKYTIPYLDSELSSYSDRYPPYIEAYGGGWSIYGFSSAFTISDGFTIDYENKTVTFSEPIYLYRKNSYGEIIATKAPSLKIYLWKQNYYTYTETPSDDPESDISNPLMFFTDKMGNYSTTILKEYNLNNLSIQEGGIITKPDGTTELIPSWDDTDFAEDYANWQLSKICDKKINGEIILTLDAVCQYNIELNKRIYIEGITDTAMNILSIDYNISDFRVRINLENSRSYKRSISLQTRGE